MVEKIPGHRDIIYAKNRVDRLIGQYNKCIREAGSDKEFNRIKANLRKWLRLYPSINRDLLASITRK